MTALTASEVEASLDSIEALQLTSGLILWTPGGHADPRNHVETAMALDVGRRHRAAERAYEWMVANQHHDGSWHQYYIADGVEDAKFDANTIAYIATGVLHHHMATGDSGFLGEMWPVVERAIDWVLELQQPSGEIFWAREPDGTQFHYALVTGSSSIAHSLASAARIAELLGKERPEWTAARARLVDALAHHETEFFAEKNRWAMDWYYPVLTGVLGPEVGRERLRARWDGFVIEGYGVRCVDDHPWVTTGETAECAIALIRCGQHDQARQLLNWVATLRHDDGSYWTGLHVPTDVHFPEGERTAYSAAAMILAHDALQGTTPASTLFRG